MDKRITWSSLKELISFLWEVKIKRKIEDEVDRIFNKSNITTGNIRKYAYLKGGGYYHGLNPKTPMVVCQGEGYVYLPSNPVLGEEYTVINLGGGHTIVNYNGGLIIMSGDSEGKLIDDTYNYNINTGWRATFICVQNPYQNDTPYWLVNEYRRQ